MRITVVGAIMIVAGVIIAVLILDGLIEKENRRRQAERIPREPTKIIGLPRV